jgi:hypothetical protein
MCAYVDKIYIKQGCVCHNLVDIIKLAEQKLFKLYYDPFTKYDNPTFDDFNFLFILSNDTFLMNWFFDLNGGEKKVYFAFLFVKGEYPL